MYLPTYPPLTHYFLQPIYYLSTYHLLQPTYYLSTYHLLQPTYYLSTYHLLQPPSYLPISYPPTYCFLQLIYLPTIVQPYNLAAF
jgi:hypothetical protein